MIEVDVDGTTYEFPDGMSKEDIKTVLQKKISAPKQDANIPALPAATAVMEGIVKTLNDPTYPLQALDDTIRSIASGATFNWADEGAAAASATLGKGTYEENVAAERARDEQIPGHTKILGNIGGGLATGGLARKAGLSLVDKAKPYFSSMVPRAAAEGATYGALYGSGAGEGAEGKIKEAGMGALYGGTLGAGTGALQKAVTPSTGPTIQSTKTASSDAYKIAEDSGVIVLPGRFEREVIKIRNSANAAGLDKTIHPKATAALQRLEEAVKLATKSGGGQPLSFQRLDTLRRIIRGAGNSNERDERRIAGIVGDEFDEFVRGLRARDLVKGDVRKMVPALNEARTMWSRYRKGETIQNLIDRAELGKSKYTASGVENSLRNEFKNLLKNPKRMRAFSKEERKAIAQVVMGSPVRNLLTILGKAAPRGVVSAGPTALGYGIGGIPGALSVAGAGEVGRRSATALTRESARMALDRILSGKAPGTITPEQAALLHSLLVGEQAGIPRGTGELPLQ